MFSLCPTADRSQHEDIDLVEEEEFYSQAPETISKPVSLMTFCFLFTCPLPSICSSSLPSLTLSIPFILSCLLPFLLSPPLPSFLSHSVLSTSLPLSSILPHRSQLKLMTTRECCADWNGNWNRENSELSGTTHSLTTLPVCHYPILHHSMT